MSIYHLDLMSALGINVLLALSVYCPMVTGQLFHWQCRVYGHWCLHFSDADGSSSYSAISGLNSGRCRRRIYRSAGGISGPQVKGPFSGNGHPGFW